MTKKLLTLVIIEQNGQVLLGMKKRGFGAGRWNGFGGKVQVGESLEAAAKRETVEECTIEVNELEERGVMTFEFQNNPELLEVHIFKAIKWQGSEGETEEMKPQWFAFDQIPYDEMWPDDRFWLPLFLAGKKFRGKILFGRNDVIVEKELTTAEWNY